MSCYVVFLLCELMSCYVDVHVLLCECPATVNREIFTLKIIHVKNFRVIKFSQFHLIRKFFLTDDDCNMDELLESSWRLVYTTRYQESRGSFAVVVDLTFNSGNVDLHTNLFTDHRHVILFFAC